MLRCQSGEHRAPPSMMAEGFGALCPVSPAQDRGGTGTDIGPAGAVATQAALCPAAIYSQLQMLTQQRATDRRTEQQQCWGTDTAGSILQGSASGFPTQPCDSFGNHLGWRSSLSCRGTKLVGENISLAVCPCAEQSSYQPIEKNNCFNSKGWKLGDALAECSFCSSL